MSNDIEPVAVFGKGVTRGRYVEASDGDILDTLGGYYISRQFWDQRLAEGRSDTARHDFRHLPVPPRSMGQGYFLDLVRCERCGEEREVGISAAQLNQQERWCVPPTSPPLARSFWRRLLGPVA